mmetsp:Transcript_18712/g.28685  ORF Transcript_18712/g.28685 Transcript_18712/m.28685 type:complete len:140 (+) Transcript_18712:1571-1990(+)
MTSLQRFTNNTPLTKSLSESIEKNLNFFWQYDRMTVFENTMFSLDNIPEQIKQDIMTNFVFFDILRSFQRFFTGPMHNDQVFLYEVVIGLMPRKFDSADTSDRVIYEEEQEVSEMYFITKGFIGTGFTFCTSKLSSSNY